VVTGNDKLFNTTLLSAFLFEMGKENDFPFSPRAIYSGNITDF
jgi:hypothetical protein